MPDGPEGQAVCLHRQVPQVGGGGGGGGVDDNLSQLHGQCGGGGLLRGGRHGRSLTEIQLEILLLSKT